MYYVGVDLHKLTSWFCILDKQGNELLSTRLPNNIKTLKQFFQKIRKPFVVALETTYNWYYFVDLAQEYAKKVYLANAYELKAFAKRKKKNDKIDSRLIADLLQKGYLPVVTIADKETRQIRELLRYRMTIVKDRSRNIFRLKALLDKLGLNSTGDFTTYKRLKQIGNYKTTGSYSLVMQNHLEQITYQTQKISNMEKEIKALAENDPDIKLLLTIPGISYFSAALIRAELISIDRFKSFNRLCAYAGLAPRIACSGDKSYHGPLAKNRSKNLQWILIENVYHFIKALPEKQKRYNEIRKRKKVNIAKVAMARDMLKIIYHVLKEQRSFYYIKKEIQLVA